MKSVVQSWVSTLTFQQQTVLLAAIRGPDGIRKKHPSKDILKWYRRCVLLNSFTGEIMRNPMEPGGGSFMGPSSCLNNFGIDQADFPSSQDFLRLDDYLDTVDELPHHYQMHFMHAVEILGYKHPVPTIRASWRGIYEQLADDLHLTPETEEQMDERLKL